MMSFLTYFLLDVMPVGAGGIKLLVNGHGTVRILWIVNRVCPASVNQYVTDTVQYCMNIKIYTYSLL